MAVEKTVVKEAVRDAVLVIIRLGLGAYRLEGVGNVLVPESRVAWATVVNELGREGYRFLPPVEYAAQCSVPVEAVLKRMEVGELFAIRYGAEELVAGDERDVPEDLGPLPL